MKSNQMINKMKILINRKKRSVSFQRIHNDCLTSSSFSVAAAAPPVVFHSRKVEYGGQSPKDLFFALSCQS